jgi:hypothetical protein
MSSAGARCAGSGGSALRSHFREPVHALIAESTYLATAATNAMEAARVRP